MNVTRYLVDNNALGMLGLGRRQAKFFRDHCRLPEDALYEARFRSDYSTLQDLVYPVTPSVLVRLRAVMSTVAPSDVSLVDLYKNLGAADPLIIASALDANANEDSLFPDTWVIVSHDKALLLKAGSLGIECVSPERLAEHIDVADGELSSGA